MLSLRNVSLWILSLLASKLICNSVIVRCVCNDGDSISKTKWCGNEDYVMRIFLISIFVHASYWMKLQQFIRCLTLHHNRFATLNENLFIQRIWYGDGESSKHMPNIYSNIIHPSRSFSIWSPGSQLSAYSVYDLWKTFHCNECIRCLNKMLIN